MPKQNQVNIKALSDTELLFLNNTVAEEAQKTKTKLDNAITDKDKKLVKATLQKLVAEYTDYQSEIERRDLSAKTAGTVTVK